MKKRICTVLIIANLVLACGAVLAASNKCRIVEVEDYVKLGQITHPVAMSGQQARWCPKSAVQG